MRPIAVKVKNFRSYKEESFHHSDFTQVCVSGANGAGKSTLVVDAPLFALKGREHVGDLDSIIGPFGTEAVVEFTCETDAGIYTITRARSKSGSGLTVTHDGKCVASGADAGQAFIDSHILYGATYKEIVAGTVMKQGEHSVFTRATPKEAKDLMYAWMGIDEWPVKQDAAKALRQEAEKDLAVAKSKLENCGRLTAEESEEIGRLAQRLVEVGEFTKELERADRKLVEANVALDKLTEEARQSEALQRAALKAQHDYNAATDHLASIERKVEALDIELAEFDANESIAALEEQVAAFDRKERAAIEYKHAREKLEYERSDAESRAKEFAEEVEQAKLALSEIKESNGKAVCSECGQTLPPDSPAYLSSVKKAESRLSGKEDLLNRTLERAGEAAEKIAALGDPVVFDQTPATAARNRLAKCRAGATRSAERAAILENALPAAERSIRAAEGVLRDATAAANTAKSIDTDPARNLVRQRQAERDMAAVKKTAAESAITRIRMLEGRAEKAEEAARNAAFEIDDAEYRAKVYGLAEKAFGRDGIPAYLMEAAIPSIENIANEMLDRMTDGSFRVRLATQGNLKNGGQKETLEIRIDDGNTERAFSTYSGGEGFRINFALRIAIAKTVANRTGRGMSMFVIDEPEGLDEPGRQHLIECLASIDDMFSFVGLISHHEDLREALPQSVTVVKDTEGSRIIKA